MQETSRQQTCVKYGICVGHCGSVYLFWLEGGLNAIQCDTSARCKTLDSGKQSQKRCPWLIIMAQKTFPWHISIERQKKHLITMAGSGSCHILSSHFQPALVKTSSKHFAESWAQHLFRCSRGRFCQQSAVPGIDASPEMVETWPWKIWSQYYNPCNGMENQPYSQPPRRS